MRRLLVLMVVAVTLVATATIAWAQPGNGNGRGTEDRGPAPKVDVCHVTGNGSMHMINISENALEAHLAHGDVGPIEDESDIPAECSDQNTVRIEVALTPEAVLANGGDYDNEAVRNAIIAGVGGDAVMTLHTGSLEATFDFEFENLEPGETYTVFLDEDGGEPGPDFVLLGSFEADEDGDGTFTYTVMFDAGTYTWSFLVNNEAGFTVLQTEDDFEIDATTTTTP